LGYRLGIHMIKLFSLAFEFQEISSSACRCENPNNPLRSSSRRCYSLSSFPSFDLAPDCYSLFFPILPFYPLHLILCTGTTFTTCTILFCSPSVILPPPWFFGETPLVPNKTPDCSSSTTTVGKKEKKKELLLSTVAYCWTGETHTQREKHAHYWPGKYRFTIWRWTPFFFFFLPSTPPLQCRRFRFLLLLLLFTWADSSFISPPIQQNMNTIVFCCCRQFGGES